MEDVTCKLPMQNNNCSCIVKTKWSPLGCDLKCFCNGLAWTGQLNEKDVEKFSSLLFMSVDTYIHETKIALTSNGGCKDFIYCIEDGTFIWTKLYQPGMSIKFGLIKLKSAAVAEVVESMICDLLFLNEKSYKLVSSLQEENKKLSSRNEEISTLLEKEISFKEEMESKLYNGCAGILNSKKKKIKDLENTFHSKDESSDDNSDPDDPMDRHDSHSNSDDMSTNRTLQKSAAKRPHCTDSGKEDYVFPSTSDLQFNLPRRLKRNDIASGSTSKFDT